MSDLGDGFDVEDFEQWIRRRLQPNERRFDLRDGFVVRWMGEIHILDLHAKLPQHALKESVSAAIDILLGDDTVPRL